MLECVDYNLKEKHIHDIILCQHILYVKECQRNIIISKKRKYKLIFDINFVLHTILIKEFKKVEWNNQITINYEKVNKAMDKI